MKRTERGTVPQRPCSRGHRRDAWTTEGVPGSGWACATCLTTPARSDVDTAAFFRTLGLDLSAPSERAG